MTNTSGAICLKFIVSGILKSLNQAIDIKTSSGKLLKVRLTTAIPLWLRRGAISADL